jgi:hypothetical protein
MSVYINPASRAADTWRAIQGQPFIVTFRRPDGTETLPQTVRLEYLVSRTTQSAAGIAAQRTLTIIGVRDHPKVPDTDIRRGYRFSYHGKVHTVLDPHLLPGEIQAEVEAV